MSTVSLPSTGYARQRSPGALAAAIALNGGIFALVIAIPAAQYIQNFDPPIRIHNVRITPLPPEVDQPKPAKEHNVTQKIRDQNPPRDEIKAVDPIIPIGGAGETLALVKGPPIGPIGGSIELPFDPPRAPVLVAARPDPRYADAFHPDYPPALRREGLEGSVTVRVTIDARGRVIAVELVKATSSAFFEETRRQALREWRFRPATRDGVPVSAEQTMTVHFRLES